MSKSSMAARERVLVAGAGPVGLLAALALASRDVPVLVLEAEPALTHDLRAGTFHPPTLEMMAPYGVTDEMHRTGIKVPRWQHPRPRRRRDRGVGPRPDRGRNAVPVPLPSRAAPADADPLRPADAVPARRGALRRACRRRGAGRRPRLGRRRVVRRHRTHRGRVAGRRRRRPKHGAEGDRRGVRGVHLAGAVRGGQHALRLRRARLHAQRLRRRPGSMGAPSSRCRTPSPAASGGSRFPSRRTSRTT